MKPLTSNTLKHHRATKARRNYLKLQDAPPSPAWDALAAPSVKGIIDPSDNTLDKDYLKSDLDVGIPQFPHLPSDPSDFVQLQLQYSLTGADDSFSAIGSIEVLTPPLESSLFPYSMAFPQVAIPRNGPLWIRYEMDDPTGLYYSSPIKLTCDSVAPWGDDPAPPLTTPTGIINQTYLANNPAGIELLIPDYLDRAPGDTYQAFYLSVWSEDDEEYDNPIAVGPIPANLKIFIPGDRVRQLGDGRFYIVYYLFDKAGNRSRIRLPATVDVVLTPEPENLRPPRVPLATDDSVLSLADAQVGVDVVIDAYTNALHQDKIAITWGTKPLAVEQIGSRVFPFSIRVPSDILRDEYGGASSVITTNVSYQVLRGEAPYGPADADFNVDFSIAGPDRPYPDHDWPDPVNDRMIAPTITSSTNLENEITPADRGQDATLTFKVFEGAGSGQVVEFYWGGTQVTERRWVVDQPTGSDKAVTIPWSYIEAAGNNVALPVHYSVRADASAINEQESLPQYVAVTAIDMTPDDLEFLGVSGRGWLNCDSIWDSPAPDAEPAIRVQVPPCSHFSVAPGTTMTLTWKVYDARVGGNPIAAVQKIEPVVLTTEQIENGFVWRVKPYDRHIKPIYDAVPLGGRAEVSYVIETAPPMPSRPTENLINMAHQGTGNSCPVPRP